MITLSNGHSFLFMVASGALAFDGRGWPWEWPLRWAGLIDPSLFTVVTKTLTRQPRRGNLRWYNPIRCVRWLPAGAVNAVGLTNPGIEWWCRTIAPSLKKCRHKIVVSIEAENEADTLEMIGMIQKNLHGNIVGIELNASCPNTFADRNQSTERILSICQKAKLESPVPLLLKVGITIDYLKLADELKEIVETFSINSVPWGIAFPDKKSPLARFGGGGVSGKIAQQWTWKIAGELAKTDMPVVGASPWEYEDIQKLFDLGVGAVSFGSLFLWHPWRPTHYVRRWIRETQGARGAA